jgi:hypothetical protein
MKNAVKGGLLAITLTCLLASRAEFAAQPKDLPKPTSQLGAPVSLTPQVPAGDFPPAQLPMPLPAGLTIAPAKLIAVTLAHGIGLKELGTEPAHHYPGLPIVLNITNASDILPANLATGAQCRVTAVGGIFGTASRPYFSTRAIGCFDHNGHAIAQGEIDGYLVGSDNVFGLRSLDDVKVGTKATVVVNSSSILRMTPQ